MKTRLLKKDYAIRHQLLSCKYLFLLLLLVSNLSIIAQPFCSVSTTGQNLIPNGNFSLGNTGFSNDYADHSVAADVLGNCPGCYRNWSMPDEYMVTDNTNKFHFQFIPPVTDVTSTADNNFLMVDGSCTAGKDAWRTNVNVISGVTYYFEAYLTTLASSATVPAGNVATVRFLIGATQLGTSMVAPTSTGSWLKFTNSWVATSTGSVLITIENLSTGSCSMGNDYGLDDISFTPGCAQGALGPKPDLGVDKSICGNSPLLLNPGTLPGGSRYKWSPGGQTTATISVTLPGTYSVCVDDGVSSCPQGDEIIVTGTYSFDIGGPYTLCNPGFQLLDAKHSGTGVTYQWFKETNGTAGFQLADTIPASKLKTYLVTTAGTYGVTVTDPSCLPAQTDQTIITSLATAIPNDANFCAPPAKNVPLSVTGPGIYNWYADASTLTVLASGTTTSTYTTLPISASTIYYVEDVQSYVTNMGALSIPAGASKNKTQLTDKAMVFNAARPLTIDSLTVYCFIPFTADHGGDTYAFQFKLLDNPADYNTTAATITTGASFSKTVNQLQTLGLIKPSWPTSGIGDVYAIRVPVGLSVATAGVYRLGFAAGTNETYIQTNMATYPYPDAALGGGVGSINFSKLGNNPPTIVEYQGMFDWRITYKSNCARIPVKAILNCSLPVDLINLTATYRSNQVLLSWSTSKEENSDRFVIERSSDGIHFSAIGYLNAAGDRQTLSNYEFYDNAPLSGINYYRLVTYDKDGAMATSEIKSATSTKNDIYISPNPNNGTFIITLSIENESVELFLVNTLGQLVYHAKESATGGYFGKQVSIESLPAGLYFLTVHNGQNTWTEKIVKQ